MTSFSARHNEMAPDLVRKIWTDSGGPEHALVLVESVLMGVCLLAGEGDERAASAYLSVVSLRVEKRLTERAT